MGNAELAYRLLYGEELEPIPDPNKPENVAYFNAKKKQREEEMAVLFRGPGRPLFERWKAQIRQLNLLLFSLSDEELDSCRASRVVREMQSVLRIWMDAESIINPEN